MDLNDYNNKLESLLTALDELRADVTKMDNFIKSTKERTETQVKMETSQELISVPDLAASLEKQKEEIISKIYDRYPPEKKRSSEKKLPLDQFGEPDLSRGCLDRRPL